jgi:hypothetical protein
VDYCDYALVFLERHFAPARSDGDRAADSSADARVLKRRRLLYLHLRSNPATEQPSLDVLWLLSFLNFTRGM